MTSHSLKILAVLLSFGTSAHAREPIGYVDGLTVNNAGGWACVPGENTRINIAAYAGPLLVGIYPMNQDRPDAAATCQGAQPQGFAFAFDPAAQALFAGQTSLTLYAEAPGLPPVQLPSSNTRTANPLPLPSGKLLGLTGTQRVAAEAAPDGGATEISLFAAGPTNEGAGTESAYASAQAGGGYGVQLPVAGLDGGLPPAALLPVFGSVTSPLGATVPLTAPFSLQIAAGKATAGTTVPVNIDFAQTGAYTAIRNNVFTTWVPSASSFAGLTGTVSLTGNSAAFDEALVELGTAPYGQAACLAQNGTSIPGAPPISRLWAGILKSNSIGTVAVPVNFALPYPVAGATGGTCLMTWISAGYAYLSGAQPQYATTQTALQAEFVPNAASPHQVIPFGMGGEFRFTGGAQPTSVYVGIMASKPLAVDGIAGTASVAPVDGAPRSSGWLPVPASLWGVQTSFIYLPAAACAAAKLIAQPGNGMFAVLRQGSPGAFSIPPGGVPVFSMPIYSAGTQAIQRSAYTAFPTGTSTGGFRGTLAVGDCLVAYSTATLEPGAVLDVENQSTVFLRVL